MESLKRMMVLFLLLSCQCDLEAMLWFLHPIPFIESFGILSGPHIMTVSGDDDTTKSMRLRFRQKNRTYLRDFESRELFA